MRIARPQPSRAIGIATLLALAAGLLGGGPVPSGPGRTARGGLIRIGALTASWGPTPGMVGFRDGLQELGYRENEHFVIGVRFTQGDPTELPAAARELVEQEVDVLFTVEASATQAAQMATKRIPIVFAEVGDPVGLGLIQSFSRPGGNITGVTDLDLELCSKRLEILREMIPGLTRVLFPYSATDAYAALEVKAYRDAARRLGVVLLERPVHSQEDARAILAGVRKGNVHGILAPRFPSWNIPGFVLEATSRRAVPAMFSGGFWVRQGALASYGLDFHESGRQAARLLDKILKGANPAEIPVEVNRKIELVLNAKTARALGLKFPPSVLARTNTVID
jgi:putative ABC transport system substrate-binding protein